VGVVRAGEVKRGARGRKLYEDSNGRVGQTTSKLGTKPKGAFGIMLAGDQPAAGNCSRPLTGEIADLGRRSEVHRLREKEGVSYRHGGHSQNLEGERRSVASRRGRGAKDTAGVVACCGKTGKFTSGGTHLVTHRT